MFPFRKKKLLLVNSKGILYEIPDNLLQPFAWFTFEKSSYFIIVFLHKIEGL